MFLENDAPTDRISFTDGRVGATLKRTYLLFGPATTNDEKDDARSVLWRVKKESYDMF